MKPVAEEIAELRAMNVAELVERHVQVFGRLPRCKQPVWLFRKIAWKIQEQRFGGLSETAKRRLEELIAEIELPLGNGSLPARKQIKRIGSTVPGTTVTRVWKGREIRATAVEGGFEFEGAVYRSLSAIAKAVTKSHWNGRYFFGLTRRAK